MRIGYIVLAKKIIFFILTLPICFLSGNPNIHPMVKSAILPGWGEAVQGYSKSSRLFIINESLMLLGCIGLYSLSELEALKYRSFAAEFAGANSNKQHRYWVDIGNFNSIDDYDAEYLRLRRHENVGKWADYPWQWDTVAQRIKFESMRIKSDEMSLAGQFFIGGIILNHIVSAIDALYLSRLKNIESLSVRPIWLEFDQTVSWQVNISLAL